MAPTEALNVENLSPLLQDLFGIAPMEQCVQMVGGYKCRNFRIQCGPDVFFLKQYHGRISHWVAEIKAAENHFGTRGVPVIVPLSDRYGRQMFLFNHDWYSLFPFVVANQPERGKIPLHTIASLGETLARLHQAGSDVPRRQIQQLKVWDPAAFHAERVEIERALAAHPSPGPLEQLMSETLARKTALVNENTLERADVPLANDHLLHGDFIYQNTFTDPAGQVSHVFDLEKTCVGPRAYEVGRSLLINCFDDDWTADNLAQGRAFVQAYRSVYPMSFDEFLHGVRMYMIHAAHMTWIEGRMLFYEWVPEHAEIYKAHALRVEHIGHDPRPFCEELYAS